MGMGFTTGKTRPFYHQFVRTATEARHCLKSDGLWRADQAVPLDN